MWGHKSCHLDADLERKAHVGDARCEGRLVSRGVCGGKILHSVDAGSEEMCVTQPPKNLIARCLNADVAFDLHGPHRARETRSGGTMVANAVRPDNACLGRGTDWDFHHVQRGAALAARVIRYSPL
jgi:hypothetical protein